MINGFLNVCKPSGMTSNRALAIIKRDLRKQGYTEKIGHFGTLDPLASGVLPIAIGRATRLFDYSLDKKKAYVATFVFGAESESLDVDSPVTYSSFTFPDDETIAAAFQTQVGRIEQIPPVFSAKFVNGVRAYTLARKGIDVTLSPKSVQIDEITLLSVRRETNEATVRILCGGGTYVRSIGRDVAGVLHTSAVMSALLREQSGCFRLEDSIPLPERDEATDWLSHLIPIEAYLREYPSIRVSCAERKKLSDGIRIPCNSAAPDAFCVYCEDRVIGMGSRDENGLLLIKTWLL